MYTKLYIYAHNKTLHYVQLFVTRTRNVENAVDVQQQKRRYCSISNNINIGEFQHEHN
mgnify:FL=1